MKVPGYIYTLRAFIAADPNEPESIAAALSAMQELEEVAKALGFAQIKVTRRFKARHAMPGDPPPVKPVGALAQLQAMRPDIPLAPSRQIPAEDISIPAQFQRK